MQVTLFGATGLVGNLLLHECLAHPQVSQINIFVRKSIDLQHPKLKQIIATLDTLDSVRAEIKGDVVFNCLGTTLRQAGSQAAQYAVDCEYPVKAAQLAAANGVTCMVNVSSVGTSETGNFYLKTKADMERGVREAIGPKSYFMRPSFITGNRRELRIGEKIGIVIAKGIDPLLMGSWRKFHSISALNIAKAMLQAALTQPESPTIWHYDEMINAIK